MVARAAAVNHSFDWPDGSVLYDQDGPADDGNPRFDCSSYVARCWELANPDSWSTVNLVNVMDEIDPADLQPADAIGLCGEGTGGDDGHIMLFTGWTQSGLAIAEQTPDFGPHHRTIKRIPDGYKAYRLRSIGQEEDGMSSQDAERAALLAATGADAGGWAKGFVGADSLVAHNTRSLRAAVDAGFAADATRDQATLAAINALVAAIKAGGGSIDAAPIVAAVNAVRDEARGEFSRLHAEVAAAQTEAEMAKAETAQLRASIVAGERAQADAVKG